MDKSIRREAIVTFGADPELFIAAANGKVVGSERSVPEAGLQTAYNRGSWQVDREAPIEIVRDGVQVELHIPASKCRQWFCAEIAAAFTKLHEHLAKTEFRVSFRQVVEVDKKELSALSQASRELGCQPSFNWYEPSVDLGIDPATYPKRSAAGHIHLGLPDTMIAEREQLPPLLDILVGNTLTLLDRDPEAAERRKVYGRAGEFRRPRHGIEYRTPSNFWLRHSKLASLVLGLSRLSVYVLDTELSGDWDAATELLTAVDIGNVQKAINENSLDLAKENFKAVSEFISRHVDSGVYGKETGLDRMLLQPFAYFVERIDDHGIQHWFPDDPMVHWTKFKYEDRGWEWFLQNDVAGRQRLEAMI